MMGIHRVAPTYLPTAEEIGWKMTTEAQRESGYEPLTGYVEVTGRIVDGVRREVRLGKKVCRPGIPKIAPWDERRFEASESRQQLTIETVEQIQRNKERQYVQVELEIDSSLQFLLGIRHVQPSNGQSRHLFLRQTLFAMHIPGLVSDVPGLDIALLFLIMGGHRGGVGWWGGDEQVSNAIATRSHTGRIILINF